MAAARDWLSALGMLSFFVWHSIHCEGRRIVQTRPIVAHGTPADMMVSTDPYVKQFVNAEADGPVPFHYPGKSLADDLGLGAKA